MEQGGGEEVGARLTCRSLKVLPAGVKEVCCRDRISQLSGKIRQITYIEGRNVCVKRCILRRIA